MSNVIRLHPARPPEPIDDDPPEPPDLRAQELVTSNNLVAVLSALLTMLALLLVAGVMSGVIKVEASPVATEASP